MVSSICVPSVIWLVEVTFLHAKSKRLARKSANINGLGSPLKHRYISRHDFLICPCKKVNKLHVVSCGQCGVGVESKFLLNSASKLPRVGMVWQRIDSTVVSQKRAHGRCTLLRAQTGVWAGYL